MANSTISLFNLRWLYEFVNDLDKFSICNLVWNIAIRLTKNIKCYIWQIGCNDVLGDRSRPIQFDSESPGAEIS